jgi:glycosyltransferase involved in cell wall biosynthesis
MSALHAKPAVPLEIGHAEQQMSIVKDATASLATRPLRVLLVTARYLPHIGGTEIHTYEVARRLVAAGNDVTVLTTDPDKRFNATEQSEGVQILRVRAWPTKHDYYFAPQIYRVITQGKWDIVHCQSYHTLVAPLAMLAAWRANIPYFVTFHSGGHSSHIRNAVRPLQRALLQPLLARAERLIGVSKFEVEFFRHRLHLPGERFAMIPNGSYLPKVTNSSGITHDDTLIISVGRLERYKGHHRIIAALPLVAQQWPDVRLRILGRGPYEPALRQMAQDLGVVDRVEIGVVPSSDRVGMASVLSGAKLVILLSDYESQGMAVLEALALGRPALVADTSSLRELVELGLVRATPLGSTAEEVAAAVLDQLRQPLIPSNVALPTWDACATELLALYRSAIWRQQCAS